MMTLFHQGPHGLTRCRAGQKQGGRPRGCPYGGHIDSIPPGSTFYRSDRGTTVKAEFTGTLKPERKKFRVKPQDSADPAAYKVPEHLRGDFDRVLATVKTEWTMMVPEDVEATNRQEILTLIKSQAGIAGAHGTPMVVPPAAKRQLARLLKKHGVTQEEFHAHLAATPFQFDAEVWAGFHPTRRLMFVYGRDGRNLRAMLAQMQGQREGSEQPQAETNLHPAEAKLGVKAEPHVIPEGVAHQRPSSVYRVKAEDVQKLEAYDVPERLKPAAKAVIEASRTSWNWASAHPQAAEVTGLLKQQAGIEGMVGAPCRLNASLKARMQSHLQEHRLTEADYMRFVEHGNPPRLPASTWKAMHPTRRLLVSIGSTFDRSFEEAKYCTSEDQRREVRTKLQGVAADPKQNRNERLRAQHKLDALEKVFTRFSESLAQAAV